MSIFRPGLFKDKVAIVTGGGSGIGMAIATELLTLGNNKNVVHLFVKFMHSRADTTCLPIRKLWSAVDLRIHRARFGPNRILNSKFSYKHCNISKLLIITNHPIGWSSLLL